MAIDLPRGLPAADWLRFLQVGVGVQCLAEGGPGAQLQSSLYSLLRYFSPVP